MSDPDGDDSCKMLLSTILFLLRSHTESLRLGHSNLDSLWSSFCIRITSSFTGCISFTIVRVVLTEKIKPSTLSNAHNEKGNYHLCRLNSSSPIMSLWLHLIQTFCFRLEFKPRWLRPIEHCCLVVGCAEIQLKLTRHNNNRRGGCGKPGMKS